MGYEAAKSQPRLYLLSINILDFNYVPIDKYHTAFHLWEDERKDYKLTDILEMVMSTNPVIAKAEELLEQLGSLDEIRRYYEAREMAIHDEVTRITGAREEGREEKTGYCPPHAS